MSCQMAVESAVDPKRVFSRFKREFNCLGGRMHS